MHNSPLVSIICTAYNQEAYIKDALESFVMQRTNFPFEIIVHDDASTDKTAQIIKEYELKYNDIFVPIYQTINQYSIKEVNIWTDITFPKARGKYIALCEGDDYWTDPLKLQKQVDFLESNPEYGLVCSQVTFIDEYGNQLNNAPLSKNQSENFGIHEIDFFKLIEENVIYTLTVCFKKELITELFDNIPGYAYDYFYWLQFCIITKLYKIQEITAAYRVHSQGISYNKIFFLKRYPQTLQSAVVKFLTTNKLKNQNISKREIILKALLKIILSKNLTVQEKKPSLNLIRLNFFLFLIPLTKLIWNRKLVKLVK